jgi:FkbM family methyltransferase
MTQSAPIRTKMWRPSRSKALLASLIYPIFYVLNRPSLAWFGDLCYDFALRCSGIAITFAGRYGLTAAEENFLAKNRDRLQNGILLDVGANSGSYARHLHLLAPGATVVAFEPHPLTFESLQRNLAEFPEIILVNQAMGESNTRLLLYDFEDSDGSTQASLSESAVALFSTKIVEHPVDCTTLDSYMASSDIDRISFLKIDTEGHDLSVLLGARLALRDQRIGMVQFEFIGANIATGATMRRFFEVLEGYDLFRMCLNGSLTPLTSYDVKRCEIYVTQNLIALPAKSAVVL